jgi:hypothetical protein
MTFYRTTFVIDVLSDGPILDIELPELSAAIDDGTFLGGPLNFTEVELTSDEVKQACYEFESDPSFFFPDEEG